MAEKLLSNLEKFINRTLAFDADLLAELAEMSGKIISLEFINTNFILFIFPSTDGIHFLNTCEDEVNVKIRGTPTDMLAYLMSAQDKNGTFSGNLEIVGDVGLAQQFQCAINNIDLDWEEHLSHWVGDTVAHKLGNKFRSTIRFTMDSKKTLELDVSEYLRFEKEILPDQLEIDEFTSLVDKLRNDVDRLKLRIDKITRTSQTDP